MGLSGPLLAQESVFKDHAEDNSERRYCLYPSTLRMINIQKNEAFNELASSFEKFLIYQLDSTAIVEKSYTKMLTNFRDKGYDEYMSIMGAGNNIVILGKEMRTNELTGVMSLEDKSFVFFLKGNVAWQKIPTIIRTMSDEDLFNVLDVRSEKWD